MSKRLQAVSWKALTTQNKETMTPGDKTRQDMFGHDHVEGLNTLTEGALKTYNSFLKNSSETGEAEIATMAKFVRSYLSSDRSNEALLKLRSKLSTSKVASIRNATAACCAAIECAVNMRGLPPTEKVEYPDLAMQLAETLIASEKGAPGTITMNDCTKCCALSQAELLEHCMGVVDPELMQNLFSDEDVDLGKKRSRT